MPIALSPDESVEVVLTLDKGKPSPPTFLCRFLTSRKMREAERLYLHALDDKTEVAEAEAALRSIHALCVSGWKNLSNGDGRSIPFDLAELDALLTDSEMWELAKACIESPRIGERDRKNSVSQRATTPAPSATTAPADGNVSSASTAVPAS